MSKPSFPPANPPWHTAALVTFSFLICVSSIPNIISSIDSVATIKSCTTPLFPTFISRQNLGWIRVIFATFILCTTIYTMTTQKNVLRVNYLKASKLRSLPIEIKGIKGQAMFTSWSWNLLGLSFAVSGLLTLYVDTIMKNNTYSIDEDKEKMIESSPFMKIGLRMCVILFEIAAPVSMLVSAVVRYALWPKALKGNGTDTLKRPDILLQHNANIVMSLVECGLLGGLKIRFIDMAVAPLFGIAYILFAWGMKHRWVESGEPQFLYFFLDTTLGKTTSIAILALEIVLLFFYVFFVIVDDILEYSAGTLIIHLAVVGTIASLLCRFRD